MEMANKKKSGVFSKIVVSVVIALNVLFTIAVLKIFLKTSSEPTVLITMWFGFTTAELWNLAGITKTKKKREDYYG